MARLEVKPYDGVGGARAQMMAEVTLSRRNLLALLHKLDMDGSHRRIENTAVYVEGEPSDELILVLRCEDDFEHYADVRRGSYMGFAGEMHPETEAFIRSE